MEKIKAIIKEVGKEPKQIEIANTLEAFQTVVGGYIEAVTIAEDMAVICNEEGRIIGLPKNCKISTVRILNLDFVGTVMFVGVNGDEFCSVPIDIKGFKKLFPNLFYQKQKITKENAQ